MLYDYVIIDKSSQVDLCRKKSIYPAEFGKNKHSKSNVDDLQSKNLMKL